MNININRFQLTDIFNIHYGVFYPIKKFVSKKDFESIVKKKRMANGEFFPIPIYFSISKQKINKIKKNELVYILYNKQYICKLFIQNIYNFTKKSKLQFAKNIFLTNNLNHPGVKNFMSEDNYYLEAEIVEFDNQIIKKFNFTAPLDFKKILKKKKINQIVGFHTRNVPHKAHEWIHQMGIRYCGALLIQPMISQYRENEYNEKIIIISNKYLVEKIYKNKKVFFAFFNSYPRYAGPKEALLHAIVRKNYGCTHFLVGRDHAGVKNFYNIYDSQKCCVLNQKQLGIKIIKFNEPYLCTDCNKIVNKRCPLCKNIDNCYKISGTAIRKAIKESKNIKSFLMRKKISKLLSKKSLI